MPVPECMSSSLSRLAWVLTSAWLHSSLRGRFKDFCLEGKGFFPLLLATACLSLFAFVY